MTTSTDSILPFALRLNALEAKVIGTPSYPDLDARAAVSAKAGESSKTAIRRMREIEEGLEKVGGEHEGLRRFIRNCKSKALRCGSDRIDDFRRYLSALIIIA